MDAIIVTFWVDTVSGAHESDLYELDIIGSKRISVNHWGSPKLTDHRTVFAIGKDEVKKLRKEHWEWREKKSK